MEDTESEPAVEPSDSDPDKELMNHLDLGFHLVK